MIIEQRTYTIQVGKMNAYKEHYESKGLAVQSRILGRPLGFFTSDLGELNLAISMWGYESYADREERRAVLAKDPEWLDYLKGSPGVILRQENRILLPASYSPMR